MSQEVLALLKMQNQTKNTLFMTSGLIDRIKEGDEVTFELQEGKKGLNAANVKIA